MIQFFLSMGPYGWILLLLSAVILFLTIRRAMDLFRAAKPDPARLERGVNAILFWGCFAAILGLLGQFSGMYRGLSIIAQAELINPKLVFLGLADALSTTITGLTLLLLSALVWFVLRCRCQRIVED
jgi:biopolymer transport protein ExbB/TolQ